MLVVCDSSVRNHDPRVELHRGQVQPAYENSDRVDAIMAALEADETFELRPPDEFPLEVLERVHGLGYIEFLRNVYAEWQSLGVEGHIVPHVWPSREMNAEVPDSLFGKLGYYSFDAATTISAHTWDAVWASTRCAMTAASLAWERRVTNFALCRPPGHHAERSRYGGYSFLNTAALAVEEFLSLGAKRVAVLDVDYHHGNGTQSIFYERADVLTISIHADPKVAYPYFAGYEHERGGGAGEGANLNFALPDGTDWSSYEPVVGLAIAKISQFQPDALVVPFGADTFDGDPISTFRLKTADYPKLAGHISQLRVPTTVTMEGGYHIESLGDNVRAFLSRFA